MKLLVQRLARVSVRSLAVSSSPSIAAAGAVSFAQSNTTSALFAARQPATSPLLAVRAFSSSNGKKTAKPSASDDNSESDSDDEEDEELKKKQIAEQRRAKAAAKAGLHKDADIDDDWDEERWGALDSEDWQGFEGDLDAMTEEGVPTWLHSVRELSAINDEKRMRAKLARRAMEEAKKNVVRHRKIDEQGRAYGTGRRKTSTARVWVKKSEKPFEGRISINKKDLVDYLVRDTHREDVLKPFLVIDQMGQFDVYCTVKGGGLTGQAGAIRHGIARALQNFDPEYRAPLKKEGLITRDPRMVERKKPGQPKARKKFQWVKR
uniref:30S ribosomal protein S9 n=1 Tax=Globisporangium ultimum (strain ATCC 200006 / CBS 805.95 / DAOM BR144) TaxID=431595 RepID=K3XB57_GLOUD